MKFKTWLETQIPFADWNSFLGQIEQLLNDMKDNRNLPIRRLRRQLDRLRAANTASAKDHALFSMSYDLEGTLGHVTPEIQRRVNDIVVQIQHRKDATQDDRFLLRYADTGNPDHSLHHSAVSPSRLYPFNHGDTIDLRKKQSLMRLYKWATIKLGSDRNSHGLLDDLEKDIYNPRTWGILLDLAEEKGLDVSRVRETLKDIFKEMPTDHQFIKGWFSNQ